MYISGYVQLKVVQDMVLDRGQVVYADESCILLLFMVKYTYELTASQAHIKPKVLHEVPYMSVSSRARCKVYFINTIKPLLYCCYTHFTVCNTCKYAESPEQALFQNF